jgi:carbonic anhydrase
MAHVPLDSCRPPYTRKSPSLYLPRVAGFALSLGPLGSLVALGGCTVEARPWPEVPTSPSEAGDSTPEEGGKAAHTWAYEGTNGPSAWGKLDPKWSSCALANSQSPVDLPLTALSTKPEVPAEKEAEAAPFVDSKIQSRLGKLSLEASHDGKLLVLAGSAQQTITIGDEPATLDVVELHQPAEHALGGVSFDFEMVLWFSPGNGKPRLALSLLFRKGTENPALAPLIDHLPPRTVYERRPLGAELALSALLPPNDSKLLSYWGSATTPPCEAQLPRLVLAQVGELSSEQLLKLKQATFGASSRPLQSLGKRVVGTVPLTPVASNPTASSVAQPVTQVPSSHQGPK